MSVEAIARAWAPPQEGLLAGAPGPLVVALATLTALAGVAAVAEVVPSGMARALGAGGAQGALLATAVAWAARPARARQAADRLRAPSPALASALVVAGAVAAAVAPGGAVAYLAAPAWLWRSRARLPGLGLARARPVAVAAGAALGAGLGMHLLLTASLTLGYGVRVPPLPALAVWLAYDAGANVLTAEAFFRGGLFERAQRRWPFPAAAALSTAACLARYLVDPLLPRSLAVAAGATFYLTLLSLGACWLHWRTASIVPGVAAGLAFFAAYRLLHVVP